MTPDQWIDLIKFFGAFFIVMTAAYKAFAKWVEAMKDRPASEDKSSKAFADAVLQDSRARREHMDSMERLFDKMATVQTTMLDNHSKAQQNTEYLHGLTRGRVESLGVSVGNRLEEIKSNQMVINETIKTGLDALAERRAA